MSTSVFTITLEPLSLPWKRTRRMWAEAHEHGFEVVCALDSRTERPEEVYPLVDQLIIWDSPGFKEAAWKYIDMCSGNMIFSVDDDELPSAPLWSFAANPPKIARFGIPVLPVLGDKLYSLDIGIQERVFPKKDWRFVGGFEGHSESPYPKMLVSTNPGIFIAHYYLEAPKDVRIQKYRDYARFDKSSTREEIERHRTRQIYEEHMDKFIPIPEEIVGAMP